MKSIRFSHILVVSCLICCLFSGEQVFAGPNQLLVDLTFQHQSMTANLKAVPLENILQYLEEEKGIWFQCPQSLMDDKISVQFSNLPLEKGLKRIFAPLDYSLTFDSKQNVNGVIIFGRSRNVPRNTAQRSDEYKKASAKKPVKKKSATTSRITKSTRDQGSEELVATEWINTPVASNVAPPENPHAKPIDTTIVHNTSPPENQDPEAKAPELNTKPVKTAGPPGGPVTMTPEEKKLFKIIYNSPPPGN